MITFSQRFDISLCSCMVNGIWIACSKFLHSVPIYQEVTFDLLLTKIGVVVNGDLAYYLWKWEFLVTEMSQYSLQHILNDFLSHSYFFEHIELFRCLLHWLNDFLSSSAFFEHIQQVRVRVCIDWMISSHLLLSLSIFNRLGLGFALIEWFPLTFCFLWAYSTG